MVRRENRWGWMVCSEDWRDYILARWVNTGDWVENMKGKMVNNLEMTGCNLERMENRMG